MNNFGPDFKQVLKYLHEALDSFDHLIPELKAFGYPEFQPMIDGFVISRGNFSSLIDVINDLEYPDGEPPHHEADNVIPLHKKPNNSDD